MVTNNFALRLQQTWKGYQDTDIIVTNNDASVNLLTIEVYNGATEITYSELASGTITFVKDDGNIVQGNLTVNAGNITYLMGTNEIAIPGSVRASIQLYGASEERLTPARFRFHVQDDLVSPSAVESTTEFSILQDLRTELEAIDVVELTNDFNSHKADLTKVFINVMNPPSPLVAAKGDWNGTTGTDDTAAINACIQYAKSVGGGTVLFSGGKKYKISDALIIDGDDICLMSIGASANLVNTTADKDTIQITPYINRPFLHNLMLTRSVTATTGIGVHQLGSLSHGYFSNVESYGSVYGFLLNQTDTSFLFRCHAIGSTSHGFMFAPCDQGTSYQWSFEGSCSAQQNGGYGLYVTTSGANPSFVQATMGTISSFNGFANGLGSMSFVGTSDCRIMGIRINNCFVGEDVTGTGIVLDTYGSSHQINNVYIETEPGYGIYITSNNSNIVIRDCRITGISNIGIWSEAAKTYISSTIVEDISKTAGVDGKKGVALIGINSSFNGGAIGNTSEPMLEIGLWLAANGCKSTGTIFLEGSTEIYRIVGLNCYVDFPTI
jgi:hypothetical protein